MLPSGSGPGVRAATSRTFAAERGIEDKAQVLDEDFRRSDHHTRPERVGWGVGTMLRSTGNVHVGEAAAASGTA